jgi:chromosome segregation ATPase
MITIKTTFEKIVKEVGSGGDTKEAVANFNAAVDDAQKAHEEELANAQAQVSEKETEIADLNAKIEELETANQDLTTKEEENATKMTEANETIETKNQRIEQLSTKVTDLEAANQKLAEATDTRPKEVTSTVDEADVLGEEETGDPAVDGMRMYEKLMKKQKAGQN